MQDRVERMWELEDGLPNTTPEHDTAIATINSQQMQLTALSLSTASHGC